MSLASQLTTIFQSCNSFHYFDRYFETFSPDIIKQGFEQASVAIVVIGLPIESYHLASHRGVVIH